MKIIPSKSAGSALTITLVTVGIIGVTLMSYLNMIRGQNLTTMRSQQWNSAIPVAEAGIEEALTHLNFDGTNYGASGWSLVDGVYTKERMLDSNRFVVSITPSNRPVIIAKAYVQIPLRTNYIDPPRTIRVTATNDALFAKGMVAKGQIDLSGNNIQTDSFDSSDPNYSNGGRYDSSKAKDSGDVATNSGLTNSFNVGNADIYGHASTGPGGSISIGSNGSVGSRAWHNTHSSGIQAGWTSDDMNVAFPDVKAPFSGGAFTPVAGNIGTDHYEFIIPAGNSQLDTISLSGQQKIIVTGDAVLYVTGNISMTGQGQIIIAPGASLKLYVAGASTSFGGNGIANSGTAMNFQYYGLPTNTSISLSGNASFTGAIYAPQADFTLGGGGNNDYDFVGASVTGTVRMNGHYNFHYDENLGKIGPRRGYTVTSWNEI